MIKPRISSSQIEINLFYNSARNAHYILQTPEKEEISFISHLR